MLKLICAAVFLGTLAQGLKLYGKNSDNIVVLAASIQDNVYADLRFNGKVYERTSMDRSSSRVIPKHKASMAKTLDQDIHKVPKFNKVSKTKFRALSNGYVPDVQQCPQVSCDFSIVFVLDSSTSVGSEDFKSQLDFIKTLIEILAIQANQYEVDVCAGIVTYAKHVMINANPCCQNSLCTLVREIDNNKIRYRKGGTNTASALMTARKLLLAPRSKKRVVFLITDGRSNYGGYPGEIARKMREEDQIDIFALGVTSSINPQEIKDITGYSFVTSIEIFDEFHVLAQALLEANNEDEGYVTQHFEALCKADNSKMSYCEDQDSNDEEEEEKEWKLCSGGNCHNSKLQIQSKVSMSSSSRVSHKAYIDYIRRKNVRRK